MKLNKILMAFAAMAMVGCSSEDFNDPSVTQAINDSRLIQLDDNFAIAGVGVDDATTRTHWEQDASGLHNKFLPILSSASVANELLSAHVEPLNFSVGLCWLNETVTENVYTNYQFYHYGWLKTGEDGANIECEKLTNGAWYNEIKFTAGGLAGGKEADEDDFYLGVAKDFAIGDVNWNSGVYKTENAAIFGGDYIVYYPYNKDFNEIGTIPAKAVTSFAAATANKEDAYLGEATFRYSAPTHIDGGAKASGFGLYNLSALVNLKVIGVSGGNIDQIVLYSAKKQLLEQANLAADKIVAGKKGKELYAATTGTKTIVANLATPAAATTSPDSPVSTYITALPTKVDDLVAYVHRADGKWAKITIGEFEFKPSSGQAVKINVTNEDFKAQYIAVDHATLAAAILEAAGSDATIEVIGDITLTGDLAINEPNVTIKGDKIIVPEDKTLTLNTNMESDVRVLGKSCCDGTNGGALVINGGTLNNVTMVPTEVKGELTELQYNTYNPTVTFSADATIAAGKLFDVQAGNVEVGAAVQHKGNITIAEDAKLTVAAAGDLQFMGATVVNNGTIEVLKAGNFDITDKDGNASADDGKKMTNNGTFIHNVDAEVGTAVQEMNQNGEYRCKVNSQIKLNDAILQWTACSVIEMVNDAAVDYDLGKLVKDDGTPIKHNNEFINFEVNATAANGATTFNNPVVSAGNGDSKNIQIGYLKVLKAKTGTEFAIDFIKGDGKRTLTVNGDMTVKFNTTFKTSKNIVITGNLNVEKGDAATTLLFKGSSKNEDGLNVTKDITVSNATFTATEDDALKIKCANFTLAKGATAGFGNRTKGDETRNMVVLGTITNPTGCTFNINAAVGDNVLGWVECKQLIVGGTFTDARPKVVPNPGN